MDGAPVAMAEEDGWFAWGYGHRTARRAFRYGLDRGAAPVFLTVVAPYRGTEPPDVSAALPDGFGPGEDRVELTVTAFGETWTVGRDLAGGEAWCRKQTHGDSR